MPSPVPPLIWNDTKGDVDADEILEALEEPAAGALSDIWQITQHDGGPSWDWFRYSVSSGGRDVIDIGFGSSAEDCKRQIAARRGQNA